MRGVYTSKLAQNSAASGRMLSIAMTPREFQLYINHLAKPMRSLVIACYNSPRNITVSGPEDLIDYLKEKLDLDAIFARKLKVTVAYHSPQMQEIARDYEDSLGDLNAEDTTIYTATMMSSVTGNRVEPKRLRQASYWVKNLVSPVLFVDSFKHLIEQQRRNKLDKSHLNNMKMDICIEIGPHSALRGPIKDIVREFSKGQTIMYHATMGRHAPGLETLLRVAGEVHCMGYPLKLFHINHQNKNSSALLSLSSLPEYEFDHSKSYWHESRISKGTRLRREPKNDLLGKRVPDWNPFEARWRHFIGLSELPWLEDHKVCHSCTSLGKDLSYRPDQWYSLVSSCRNAGHGHRGTQATQ